MRRSRWSLREPTRDLPTQRHRVRNAVEDDARDLLDQVDLAGHVAGAPRRHGHLSSRRETSKPSRSRIARCSSGATSRPMQPRRALRPQRDDRTRRAAPRGRPRHPSSRRRRDRRASGSPCTAAGSARYGSTPFSHRFEPAVRSASRSDVPRIPIGSKFAASRSTSVVVSPTSALEPAHDRGERDRLLAVGDQEIARVEPPQRPVERPQLLSVAGVSDDDRAVVRARCDRTRAAGCPTRA